MDFFDSLETRSADERERWLAGALPKQIAHAKRVAPYFATLLAEVDPGEISARAALAQLPVTRKSDLGEMQRQAPPFGGLASTAP
ncbi:MAG TPA: phenylacetate--CoA ligase family protein, partial [Burkholderiales bacterium]|nr:phenylacetate--CoA ligase family protein [Burkholderiales bacterium]